ncbi:MAG: 16S rRNA (adenine(1518)-N(6)/adenine(1519)-N(6))-dimethyltransferase RsmA [Holosporaceae bacterium]|jgi:16S rRNA (adenine1518-N6/adenine1519-N6)-dimethyltransferase|nr:16S rRNA (adenine(1518)-N(6)/adenine(1519)-N(6))-dimethyltransferase RsmA [Holosporaceae bacterium]
MLESSENLSAKKIFDLFRGKTDKKLGQNFLFDPKINRKIVGVAGDLTGKTVIEVGPGPGGLTLEILRSGVRKAYIVELDRRWVAVWKELSPLFGSRLEVIEADALKFDFKALAPDVIISNLPYNISTQLLFKWLREFDLYETLVLMFQKEVADRLCAEPACAAYGKLSVLTRWKSRAEKAFDLEAGSFFPVPAVKSSVIKFTPRSREETPEDFDVFSHLLAKVFMHRRKKVVKALSDFFPNPEKVLSELGYDTNARAEEISAADYVKMLKKMSGRASSMQPL